MKISARRYRQSRQGATLTSSKWLVPTTVGGIVGLGVICAALFSILQ